MVLPVRVQPRASANALRGWVEGRLHVRLTAPPVEDAANRALCALLAAALGLKPSAVELVAGRRSREKSVRLTGITLEDAIARTTPANQD